MKITNTSILILLSCIIIAMSLRLHKSEEGSLTSSTFERKNRVHSLFRKEEPKKEEKKEEPKKEEKKGEKKEDAKKEEKKEESKTEEKKPEAANNGTNVYGIPKDLIIVDKAPFNITQCDQVIQYESETFVNNTDYSKRKPAFFTLSAFMINMFSNKSSSDLLESISLSSINVSPSILHGSKSCVNFEDSTTSRQINMCFKTKEEAENILKAYQTLLNCRGGADLHKEAKTKVIKASCNGILQPNGEKYDFGLVKDLFAEELKKEGFAVKGVGINGKDITKKMLENEDEAKVAEMKKFIVPGTL